VVARLGRWGRPSGFGRVRLGLMLMLVGMVIIGMVVTRQLIHPDFHHGADFVRSGHILLIHRRCNACKGSGYIGFSMMLCQGGFLLLNHRGLP
jgi:hypothetical protein